MKYTTRLQNYNINPQLSSQRNLHKTKKAMRRSIVMMLLSLFLLSGSGYAYADNHRGGQDKGRKEQKYDRRPTGNKDKGANKKVEKNRPERKPGNVGNVHNPQPQRPVAPAPPKAPGHAPRHYNHAYHYPNYSVHDNLGYMVSRVTRGGSDVNVWQVDPNTYVVKFRRGPRMYAQYLYPYEGRYGACNAISLDWAPLSPWSLIPSVHLNINL